MKIKVVPANGGKVLTLDVSFSTLTELYTALRPRQFGYINSNQEAIKIESIENIPPEINNLSEDRIYIIDKEKLDQLREETTRSENQGEERQEEGLEEGVELTFEDIAFGEEDEEEEEREEEEEEEEEEDEDEDIENNEEEDEEEEEREEEEEEEERQEDETKDEHEVNENKGETEELKEDELFEIKDEINTSIHLLMEILIERTARKIHQEKETVLDNIDRKSRDEAIKEAKKLINKVEKIIKGNLKRTELLLKICRENINNM